MPADTLDVINPLRPGADPLAGRIERIHLETADAATVFIKPGAADWPDSCRGRTICDWMRRTTCS